MFENPVERWATITVGSLQTRILVTYAPSDPEPRWHLPSSPNVPRDCPDCGRTIHFATLDSSGREIRCACGATFPVSDLI